MVRLGGFSSAIVVQSPLCEVFSAFVVVGGQVIILRLLVFYPARVIRLIFSHNGTEYFFESFRHSTVASGYVL
jgi:hypothetical protein